jgi:Uma2 family endonuclease
VGEGPATIDAMASATKQPRMTVEDFLALGEGVYAELIDGEIFMNATPTFDHQRAAQALGMALYTWAGACKAGQALCVPIDVYLPSGDIVEPDVLFISTPRLGIIQDWIRGVPDLLVEVLSPSNAAHDRVIKHRLYASNGVPEYWIVDPKCRCVDVFRLRDGEFLPPEHLGVEGTLTSPLLPGFALPVKDLFFA